MAIMHPDDIRDDRLYAYHGTKEVVQSASWKVYSIASRDGRRALVARRGHGDGPDDQSI